ncbi:hypothetical protein LTR94_038763, partial [Friedmanniomyces endolithicus]
GAARRRRRDPQCRLQLRRHLRDAAAHAAQGVVDRRRELSHHAELLGLCPLCQRVPDQQCRPDHHDRT